MNGNAQCIIYRPSVRPSVRPFLLVTESNNRIFAEVDVDLMQVDPMPAPYVTILL